LDLDGVIWLDHQPIAGAAAAVEALRAAGEEVVFVTNNASARVAEQEEKLAAIGIPAAGSVVTSAVAGAGLLDPGERVFVIGGPGLHEEVRARGSEVVDGPDCDAVISGLDRALTYDALRTAGLAIRRGARWILTNPDVTFPTPHGLEPGAGSIGAAIAAATGATPVVAGKPHEPMVRLLRARLGDDGVVVGDRPDTDGRFAGALGYRFGLVLSGVTGAGDLPVDPVPDWVADDLLRLVEAVRA
jgi:4-nitrophenyl phosphatase